MTDQAKDTQAMVPHRPQAVARWRMAPSSLGEAMEMATLIVQSDLCPKAYKGKAGDAIVAYEYGAALGLSWMQALRSVSVINGQGSLWGDAIPALIYGSGECERFHEFYEGTENTDGYTAVCIMRRRGMPDEVKRTFSVAEAKKANLWTKANTPWQTYPNRMLQMRARGFAARDTFADKLSGLILAEEAMDYPVVEGTVVSSEVIDTPQSQKVFEALPEALRDNIEKAFETLNMSPAQRLTKLNEYLGGTGVDPEASAQQLLEWCKDEYSKRKTGQPRARKGADNGKKTPNAPESSTAAPTAKTGAVPSDVEKGSAGSTDSSPVADSGKQAGSVAPPVAAETIAQNPPVMEDLF